MKIIPMVRAELRRLTATPMALVALIALMCVPLLYGGLYLWANQDPYARLNQVPAAVVVSDRGTTVDEKTVNYGDRVADELVDDDSFAWHRVSAAEAKRGVDDSTYDFALVLPADFSDALVSAQGSEPRQATVTLTTNDVNSYLSSTIGQQAAERVRATITRQVDREAAGRILLAISDIRSNLVTASDGATQLASGLDSASSGASTLADGTAQVAAGAATVRDGLGDLRQATAQLPAQTSQLAEGAARVSAGDARVAAAGREAASASAQAAAAVPQTRAALAQALLDQGIPQDRVDALLTRYLDPLGARITTGDTTVQQTSAQLDQLASGAAQVASGTRALADRTPALASGIGQAASGAATLADGATQTASGAASVRDGLGSLDDGAHRLSDGLGDGLARIPDSSATLRDQQASTIADPVDLEQSRVTDAGGYGAGLAPFFATLAAWIGIYALFLIVKPVSRRAITALHSPVRITLAGWLTPGLLGAVQMVALFTILSGALGFRIDDPLGTYGIMALASLTFAAIILTLNVWLGSVGQFLGLVLMVVQLVTAGGTFPWQTLPAPLAALHHVMPMSFAVDGMRQLMYGGSADAAAGDAGVLALFLVAALVVTGIGVTRMTHGRTLRDLQPSLIG